MSRGANLSVLGLYSYDPTVFDNLAVPTGFDTQDKQLLVDNIVLECAELEILYPNATVFKAAVGAWSNKELPTWERIYQAEWMQYNPIENYNRVEKTNVQNRGAMTQSGNDSDVRTGYDSVVGSGNTSDVGSGTITDANSGTITDVKTGSYTDAMSGYDSDVGSGKDTTTNSITSFDSNTLQVHDQSEVSPASTMTHNKNTTLTHTNNSDTNTRTLNDSTTHTRADTVTHNRNDTETQNYNSTFTHNFGKVVTDTTGSQTTSQISGNIGVTTSQQMLEQELEVAPKLNVMNYIIDSFRNRFCLLVF